MLAFDAAGSATIYVAKDNVGAAEPYDTWETAAANVKTAAIYATNLVATASADSVEILVGSGNYNTDNNIYLCAGVTLRGATGNREDVVVGQSSYTSKTTKRIITASGNGAVIADLTVTGGYVYEHGGNSPGTTWGGGVYLANGATITNCHVTSCIAHYGASGAGMWLKSANAYDVLVDNCTHKPWAAATHIQVRGFAVYVTGSSIVDRCQIVDNKTTGAKSAGTYLCGALCVYNTSNASIVRNCLIARNQVTYTGGSYYIGTGIGCRGGTIENCTVVSNTASVAGNIAGVVLYPDDTSTIRNCHIAGNLAGEGLANYTLSTVSGKAGFYQYYNTCCTIPLQQYFTTCKLDVDGTWEFDAKGRFRLLKDSPCIAAASQQTWMVGATDLYGNGRKLYGNADIGAVEYVKGLGFILILR